MKCPPRQRESESKVSRISRPTLCDAAELPHTIQRPGQIDTKEYKYIKISTGGAEAINLALPVLVFFLDSYRSKRGHLCTSLEHSSIVGILSYTSSLSSLLMHMKMSLSAHANAFASWENTLARVSSRVSSRAQSSRSSSIGKKGGSRMQYP